MSEKKLSENKNRYHTLRHHAWAGSVLLAILLAVRILLDISDNSFEYIDSIVLVLGAIIIVYTISALFFTYKYRSDLSNEKKTIQIISSTDDLEKEKIKIEKKKAKAEVKKKKKI